MRYTHIQYSLPCVMTMCVCTYRCAAIHAMELLIKHEVYIAPRPKRIRTYARALPGHMYVYMHSDMATSMTPLPCPLPAM